MAHEHEITRLQIESLAYASLFTALGKTLGSHFIEMAMQGLQSGADDPNTPPRIAGMMTEALAVIEDVLGRLPRPPGRGSA